MAGTTSPDGGPRATGSKPNLYEVIRDQLIGEIESGRYPAGALLPSVRELTAQMAISTTTARKALAEVVGAGYARSEGTRGHVSSGARPQTPTEDVDEPSETTYKDTSGTLIVRPSMVIPAGGNANPETERTTVDVRREPGPADVALALQLQESTEPLVVRRRLTTDAHGMPLELRTSYLISDFAQDTSLASPEPIEGSWAAALTAADGETLGAVKSQVTARHPTDAEAAILRLRPAACALVRTKTTYDRNDRPIDHTITVWPGENTRLDLDV